tara:strand:- start:213 stop:566 length:354 start_codon:yes stop_codon:yes gene_type:complete
MRKLFLILCLSISLKTISSSVYLDDLTDDQICGWVNNPSPHTRIVADVNIKSLYCDSNGVIKIDKAPIINSTILVNKLKSLNQILRGKKPIYRTKGGTQIKIETLDDEKSIIFNKLF